MKRVIKIMWSVGLIAAVLTTSGCGGGGSDTVLLPDLTITKSHVGNFNRGQTGAKYTVTVKNVGVGPTSGVVTVAEAAPTGLTVTSLAGTGWDCSTTTNKCTRSDVLNADASYPAITVSVDVAVTATTPLVNSVTVSGGGEVKTDNNSASDSTTITVPDLTITKNHVGNFRQGQTNAAYTLTVSNSGAGATGPTARTVTVTDTMPQTGFTLASISGDGWTCNNASISCTRSDALAVGTSYAPITVTVNVTSDAPTSLTNSATVSVDGDINTANNSASSPTVINVTVNSNVADNFPAYDASAAGVIFEVHPTRTYTYNIDKFAAGDKIVFDAGTAVGLTNVSGTDHTIDLIGSLNNNVVTVHLTGVDAASDAAIFNITSFKAVFGSDSLAP